MNVYTVTVSYVQPVVTQVNILARDEKHALERLEEATDMKNAPPEYKLEVISVELTEENVPVDESEIEEAYVTTKRPERILN